MPATEVIFYKDADGTAPALEWLQELRKKDRRAFAKCAARIRRLADLGFELRRPEADLLRDGIYELREKGHVQYRILYFYHGRNVAVLSQGLTKKDRVPDEEITRAVKRKQAFLRDPEKHSHIQGDQGNAQDQERAQDHRPDGG